MAKRSDRTDGAKTKKRPAVKRNGNYRKRQRNTSVFFLLWAAFSALSLLILLLFGGTQRFAMTQTYKAEAARDLTQKGTQIQSLIKRTPSEDFDGDRSGFLHMLSAYYDVDVYILSEDGKVLLPKAPDFQAGEEELRELFDFSDELAALKANLAQTDEAFVVYEGEGEYVYGSKIALYEDSEVYLYIAKSMQFVETASREMGVRLWLIAAFLFLLSFAVSSAASGWFTRPITEMTKKAHRLAKGDFNVDFHGSDYGKEMVELADALNHARDELSKTDKMQKELIANVSHDFKTPLTMIKAYASMIIEISGDIPEKRDKHARVIVDEADRLTSLVSDVLDLSKIRSDIDTLKRTNVDMSAYLVEILARFDYLCETQGYTFVTDIDEELCAFADESKIGQALYNLIGNAVNYTGADKTVYVRLKAQGDGTFRFAVTDTGAGIKQEELAEIWDRYYRSAEAHKRPVKGTGLGLSIVKTVLEKHGFAFGVESEVGKGSTFYVIFPAERDETLDNAEEKEL